MAIRITGGKWRGRELTTVKSAMVRPTSSKLRQALFNALQTSVEDSKFLELFAGTGAISIEALSRGAQEAVAVEKGRAALRALGRNAAQFMCQTSLHIVAEDVYRALERGNLRVSPFDWIFADPPYAFASTEGNALQRLLELSSYQLKRGGHLYLERARRAPALGDWGELKHLSTRTYGDSCLESYQRI